MKVLHGGSIAELVPLIPIFLSYILSFIYVGIYWNNRYHLAGYRYSDREENRIGNG